MERNVTVLVCGLEAILLDTRFRLRMAAQSMRAVPSTLWVFSFTSESGIIRSACPHCGAKLSVWFERGKIVKWEPQGILLFLGVKMVGGGGSGELGCPFINLFPGPEHVHAWRSKTPDVDGVLLTKEETEKLARVVASRQEMVTLEFGKGRSTKGRETNFEK